MSPAAPLSPDERERVLALHDLHILDTPVDERFECLVRFVRQKLQVPIALISLVDTDRQWFKVCQGLTICETSRDASFCAYTILEDEILLVTDARKDERFADNIFVTGPPFIRFYAGCPLKAPQGEKIGSLCVIDRMPRHLEEQQLQRLKRIACMVEYQIYKISLLDQQSALQQKTSTSFTG